MRVSDLIEILQQADPEEFVDIGYWEYRGGEMEFTEHSVRKVGRSYGYLVITDDENMVEDLVQKTP